MIIGYCLYGQDNDTYMLEDDNDLIFCPKCHYLKDFNYHNSFFKIKRKIYDFSHPYDIGSIASFKFKEFCIRENYADIIFKEFELSFGFFQVYLNKILEIDPIETGTRFKDFCIECGNYSEVIGSVPLRLKNLSTELEDGFYRTDVLFGSGNCKNPITIIGPKTYEKLKKEKLKGLFYKAIEV